jgi:hypothetical protein
MSAKKNKGWPELGIITKNVVKDKDGNVVKGSNGEAVYRLGFKLSENVTVLVDGQPVELNKYRSGLLTTPVDEIENLYKNGAIGDDKIEERRATAKEKHTWLRYKIQLPPPKAD